MKDQVLKAMQDADRPVRPGDVAEALKALRADGSIVSPKRCFYEPAQT